MANDLMIYGAIGWDVNALDVVGAVSQARGQELSVRVNSPGGYVWEGLAIANAIKAHGNVSTTVDALAASMGSVIFLAGKRRTMTEGSRLMIHNPASFAAGAASDLRKEASVLDGIAADMATLYSEATGGKVSVEDAAAMMEAETWLTPDQAVELGFAHSIQGKATAFAKIPETIKYRNAPKEVVTMSTENTENPGLLERMLAKVSGADNVRADLTQARADLSQAEASLAEAVGRLSAAEARATAAEASLEAAKAEHVAALEAVKNEHAATLDERVRAEVSKVMSGNAPAPLSHQEPQPQRSVVEEYKRLEQEGSDAERFAFYEANKTEIDNARKSGRE